MDYQAEVDEVRSTSDEQGYNTDRQNRRHGRRNDGVKRQAVSETAQKSQQGSGNGVMTNIAETQTITVTYNFNF
nr:MAG: hypothetical protein 2 [Procedovirinae sp.]